MDSLEMFLFVKQKQQLETEMDWCVVYSMGDHPGILSKYFEVECSDGSFEGFQFVEGDVKSMIECTEKAFRDIVTLNG
jgi:hypothetical protein